MLFYIIIWIWNLKMKNMNRGCYFIFINIFLFKKKSCIDITGHDLLDINIMHLFIHILKLYCVVHATKTDFPLSHEKYNNKKTKKL